MATENSPILHSRERILRMPDTYIGSVEKQEKEVWIWKDGRMVRKRISFPHGLYTIFDEVLVNSSSRNIYRKKVTRMKVDIDCANNRISVWNNHGEDFYAKAAGRQEHHALKLANIFSTEFTIEVAQGSSNRRYRQSAKVNNIPNPAGARHGESAKSVFKNNMGKTSEPSITRCNRNENWTIVSFKPDLHRFGMERLEDDIVALMKRRVIDLACCVGSGVKIELDGTRVLPNKFKDYVKLYPGASSDRRVFEKVNCKWEVAVGKTNGDFTQVSFVNKYATVKGGSHVDHITDQLTSSLASVVKLEPSIIKSFLSVYINSYIDNPAFDSHTKEYLVNDEISFESTCTLTARFLKKVSKTGVIDKLLSYADSVQNEKLRETHGKRKGTLSIPKLEDAYFAGTASSGDCTLILTEGDSAKAVVLAGFSVVGQDYYGVFPLKGKLLNVREASLEKMQANTEIQNIKKILGLEHGKIYANASELRYGHLMIMADQDHDGTHIKGLLINFLHSYWPSLLKVPGFMLEFVTPIIKATDKNTKKVISFYTMLEYRTWKENLGNKVTEHVIKYYKGLGTSDCYEAREYFSDLEHHVKYFVWVDDKKDSDAMELAFCKKMSEARKTWLRELKLHTHIDSREKFIPINRFINEEFILYSEADNHRSIPSSVDGLKPSQRKILFCAFNRLCDEQMKVAQFTSYVSQRAAYHHGEESLVETIIGMAQDYVGSNNVNLLQPKGQFGTRQMGGKDHASGRYIYTELSPITRYIFRKEDDILLQYLNEDGKSIEPQWYMPVIPMVLVNESEGIGTGWSSSIPGYNINEIIENIRRLLRGKTMVRMHPWYKGFKGTIERKTASTSNDTGYITTGTMEKIGDKLVITELPLKMWTQEYHYILDAALKDKTPFFEDYVANNTHETVRIEILLTKRGIGATYETLVQELKLTTPLSIGNMNLFNANGDSIKKYNTPEQILEDFFPLRLEFYGKRKDAMLKKLMEALSLLDSKLRFMREVSENRIILLGKKPDEICADLREKGFTPLPKETMFEASIAGAETKDEEGTEYDYLMYMPLWSLTFERVQKVQKERDAKKKEIDELSVTDPGTLWERDLDALQEQLCHTGVG